MFFRENDRFRERLRLQNYPRCGIVRMLDIVCVKAMLKSVQRATLLIVMALEIVVADSPVGEEEFVPPSQPDQTSLCSCRLLLETASLRRIGGKPFPDILKLWLKT